jgi:hypothetical protein
MDHAVVNIRKVLRRLFRAHAALLIPMVCMHYACTEPRIIETSLEACRNGIDDDGDGLIDCTDPACMDSGACEGSLERCRNGLDDDRDGQIDCNDEQCKPFCGNYDVACEVGDTGACPIGMSCYPRTNTFEGAYCSRTGLRSDGKICAESDDCSAGATCYGVCGAVCSENSRCARSGYCAHLDGKPGACISGCVPALAASGCDVGTQCITLHHVGIASNAQPSIAGCSRTPAWAGTLAVGDACDDPPLISAVDKMCAPGLVCWPDAASPPRRGVCRRTCGIDLASRGNTGCSVAGTTCRLAFPQDQRANAVGRLVQGLCLP